MKKVLIVQPFRKPKFKDMIVTNYPYWEVMNLEALTLAAVIEQDGYEVHFLTMQNMFKSFNNNQNELLESILVKFSPDILIIATDYYMANGSTAIMYSTNKIIDYYKSHSCLEKTILIGRNVLALREKIFGSLPNLDVAIKGEAEEIINDLLKCNNEKLHTIKGIIYKNGKEICETEGYGTILNWENMPLPAFHLLNESILLIEEIAGIRMKRIPVTLRTSFGCTRRCNYCAGIENWNEYHTKPYDYFDKEINLFYNTFPNRAQLFFLADEIFTVDKNHVKSTVKVLSNYGIKVQGLFAHTHFFDDEIAEEIKTITDTVLFGAENCSNRILEKTNKNQSFEQLISAVDLAKKHGLKVSLEWIVGLPGETVETALMNLNKIYEMIVTEVVDNINTYVFCPHPNTEFEVNSEYYHFTSNNQYSDMLEEGGYPCAKLKKLDTNQVYIYYLMSQIIISEAHNVKGQLPEDYRVGSYNLEMFTELFKRINKEI